MNTTTGYQMVIEHFKRNGWNFQADATRSMLHAFFQLRNGAVRCIVGVDPSDDFIQVAILLPVAVPAERRSPAGELCVRLSSTLKMGRFDLNYQNGELRFNASCPYPKGELKDEVIRRVIGVSLATVEQQFLAFAATLYANALPAVAAPRLQANPAADASPAVLAPLHAHSRLNLN